MSFFVSNRIPLALMTLMAFLTITFVFTFADAAEASRLGAINKRVDTPPPQVEKKPDGTGSDGGGTEKKGFFRRLLDGVTNLASSINNMLGPLLEIGQAALTIWALWQGASYLWGMVSPGIYGLMEKVGLKKPTPVLQPMSEIIQDPNERAAFLIRLAEERKIQGEGFDLSNPTSVYRIHLGGNRYVYVTEKEACERYNWGDTCVRVHGNETNIATTSNHHVQFTAVTQNLSPGITNTLTYRYEVSDFVGGVIRAQGQRTVSVDWDMIRREGLFGCMVPLSFPSLEYEYNGKVFTRPGVIVVPRIGVLGTSVGQQDFTDCVEWTTMPSTTTGSANGGVPSGNRGGTPPTTASGGTGSVSNDLRSGGNEFNIAPSIKTEREENSTTPNSRSENNSETPASPTSNHSASSGTSETRESDRTETTTISWPSRVSGADATLHLRVTLSDGSKFKEDIPGWAYRVVDTSNITDRITLASLGAKHNVDWRHIAYLNIELGTIPGDMIRKTGWTRIEAGTLLFVPDTQNISAGTWSNIDHLMHAMLSHAFISR